MLQPNVHPVNPIYFPTDMRSLVSSSINTEWTNEHHCRSIQKVKGLKSLNMELSWTPFQFGFKIPTDEEVTKVKGDSQDSDVVDIADVDKMKVASLLKGAALLDVVESKIFRGWESLEHSVQPAEYVPSQTFEVLLTREERRRLAGESDAMEDDEAESHKEI